MSSPTERDAIEIVRRVLGDEVRRVARFPTGLHHWVYDVSTRDGRTAVVRIGAREARPFLAGAVFWEERLRPLGVPLPRLLYADLDMTHSTFPFLVLERLPGTDLGNVYGDLGAEQRSALAFEMAELQRRAGRLPEGGGFGYALDDSGRGLQRSWTEAMRALVGRSAGWIAGVGIVEPVWIDRVEARLGNFEHYLNSVAPRAFLHDITTKNVIVESGRLSGIVDVDSMGYGDPLLTVALTRMSLLARGEETDYIDAWCDAMELSVEGRRALDLYTALHCLAFLGEEGQAFNRDSAEPVDPQHLSHLTSILASMLS